MSEHKRIRFEDREYDSHITLWVFNEDRTGEAKIGAVDYLWGVDGSEVCDPAEAVKVTTIDGEEILLTSEHMLRQEITDSSIWSQSN